MKMKKTALLLLSLIIIFSGCSQQQSSTPNTGSVPITKHYSFMGVTLNMTSDEVTAILGAPNTDLGTSIFYTLTDTSGSGDYVHLMVSLLSGRVSSMLILNSYPHYTGRTSYSLDGITLGDTATKVKSYLGDPTSNISGATKEYTYYYSNRYIELWFDDYDQVIGFGIYQP